MPGPQVNAVGANTPIYPGEAVQANSLNMPANNASPTIDKYFEKVAKDQLNANKSDVDLGVEKLNQAAGKTGYVDSEIRRLSAEIKNDIAIELAKKTPSWTNVDLKIRQLAVYLLRKSGINEQEISHEEVKRMREDILNVMGTYNSKWSLVAAIGTGIVSIIGGLVGIGGGIAGIAELAKGAAKVSATVNQFTQIGTSASSLANGVSQAVNGPLSSHYEARRTMENANLENNRNKKDLAQQAVSQNANALQGIMRGISSTEESVHSAAMGILRA